MKSKRVWRYYCEFCGKSGCGKAAMIKHESRCTMNPNRECGMCNTVGESAVQPLQIIEQHPLTFRIEDESMVCMSGSDNVEKYIKDIREACHNCPACMLAVFRQAKIAEMISFRGFSFKQECQEWWNEINSLRTEEEQERNRAAAYAGNL